MFPVQDLLYPRGYTRRFCPFCTEKDCPAYQNFKQGCFAAKNFLNYFHV